MMDDFYDDWESEEEGEDLYHEDTETEEDIFDTIAKGIGADGADDTADTADFGPDTIGLALAVADGLVRDSERRKYDLDENTDKENMAKAMEYCSPRYRTRSSKKLRPFEQYVRDICEGRKSLFDQ